MWYTASLFYRGEHLGGNPDKDLWEESIVLLDADSEDDAWQKAAKCASEAYEYKTITGDRLKWSFDSVSKVVEVDAKALQSGVELFWRFLSLSQVNKLKTPFIDEV